MVNDAVIVGLKLWIVFLLLFVLLQYPVTFSIFLGALAGWAGGFINDYWLRPKPPKEQSRSLWGDRQLFIRSPKTQAESAAEKPGRARRGLFARRKRPGFGDRR